MDLTNLNRDRKRRKSSLDLSTMVYGKVPPQAKDLEEAVLGAIMLEKNAKVFFVTKCVDLDRAVVLIFFKLCMTMKVKMDNP